MFNAAIQDDKWLMCVAIAFDDLDAYFDDKTEMFQPARPADAPKDVIAWVREQGDRYPEAVICSARDGRLFYVPVGAVTGTLHIDRAEQVQNPPLDLRYGAKNTQIEYGQLGPVGGRPNSEAKMDLLTAYYGAERAHELSSQYGLT